MTTRFTLPPITITATLLGGRLVALFNGVSYTRKLISLVVLCSVPSAINVYAGIIAQPGLIESNPVGANNTYNPTNPSIIRAGYPMYIEWPDAVGASDSARATAVFEGWY